MSNVAIKALFSIPYNIKDHFNIGSSGLSGSAENFAVQGGDGYRNSEAILAGLS